LRLAVYGTHTVHSTASLAASAGFDVICTLTNRHADEYPLENPPHPGTAPN